MAGGAGTYNISNSQNGEVSFTNSNGTIVNLLPGGSGQYAITAAVWSSLVSLLGAAHVVPIVVNPTYKYAVLSITPVAAPTDFIIIQGSATKTINITKIRFSGLTTTTAGSLPFQVIRRSTAGTLGTATLTAVTPALTDTLNPPATAVVSYVQTANLSAVGTANPVGNIIDSGRINMQLTAAGGGEGYAVHLRYSDISGQTLKLRGTSDFIAINFNGATLPGTAPLIDFVIETEEDAS